jgi:hypothetical protein
MKAMPDGLTNEEKIWCQDEKCNIMVDCTKGGKHLDEIEDAVVADFQVATKEVIFFRDL